MLDCSVPTLICRRTGEVAAANKEFMLLTGWKDDVLLGKEANLNINTGRSHSAGNSSGSAGLGNAGRAVLATPKEGPLESEAQQGNEGKLQPVLLAELLDDDSVIEFYEDFAKLAFGDSRGSVTALCRLLKYQTKGRIKGSPEVKGEGSERRKEIGGGVKEIDGMHTMNDWEIDCSYCWTVKRNAVDLPALIVMNVSFI